MASLLCRGGHGSANGRLAIRKCARSSAEPGCLSPARTGSDQHRSRDDWLKRLDDSGVSCGAIRTVAEVCDGEVLKARGMIAEMPHSSVGNVKAIKSAIHLSETALDT